MEDKTMYDRKRIQQIVSALQMADLKVREQLERLREFQREHDGQFTPEANDYLREEIRALSDFCSRRSRRKGLPREEKMQ